MVSHPLSLSALGVRLARIPYAAVVARGRCWFLLEKAGRRIRAAPLKTYPHKLAPPRSWLL